MEAAMDLMRRMPPGSTETALNALLSLLPDHSLDLLSQVDLPLQVGNRRFLLRVYTTSSSLIRIGVKLRRKHFPVIAQRACCH